MRKRVGWRQSPHEWNYAEFPKMAKQKKPRKILTGWHGDWQGQTRPLFPSDWKKLDGHQLRRHHVPIDVHKEVEDLPVTLYWVLVLGKFELGTATVATLRAGDATAKIYVTYNLRVPLELFVLPTSTVERRASPHISGIGRTSSVAPSSPSAGISLRPAPLFLISRMARSGHAVHFEKDSARVLTPDRATLFVVPECNGLYPVQEVQGSSTPMTAVNAACTTLTLHEFHCRMGHTGARGLQNMVSRGIMTGIKLTDTDAAPCRGCDKGLLKHKPPHTCSTSSEKVYSDGDTHCSTWGPAPTASLGHKLYATLFLDSKTDEVVIVGLEKKSEETAAYKQYQAWAKVHRSTTSGETGGNSSVQGSSAKRVLQTLLTHTRTMLRLADLPTSLWLEALSHAAWLRNRTETAKTIGGTPCERAMGDKPNLSQVRRFGANIWVKLEHASKIDLQAKPCRWVGIDVHAKSHRIYWPEKRTVTVEQNVRFEGEPEDVTYPSVPIGGEMGENGAREARNPPTAPPDAAPEAPSNESAPENSPAAPDAPSAPDAPDPTADAPPTTPETIRPPSPVPTPESSHPSLFSRDDWLRGAIAFTTVRSVVAGNEAPSPPTLTRVEDAPTTREASPSPASPTDEHEESAEEEDGVTTKQLAKLNHEEIYRQ
ncbi:hypothetical protein DFH08DRAFT_799328 [Mycena albidolilacea]|uniref:Retroviral polymerase SH3-like domain-containing protein n=1 Tax=Mycena albidolilacea TaxID=1033008 RepID=A0AAD7F1T4_9AGAR|nr:hypothetical protein DFH08DRAFT_799328 [Mycena albidolilacea]